MVTESDQDRHPVALRPDQLEQLAAVLNVSISDLLEDKEVQERKTGTGPTGTVDNTLRKLPDKKQYFSPLCAENLRS